MVSIDTLFLQFILLFTFLLSIFSNLFRIEFNPLQVNVKIGLQAIDPSHKEYYMGENKEKRSMMVIVMNYTPYGSACRPCELEDFGTPFVSFIMEGDDHASVCQRFSELTGESVTELMEHRLALVSNKLPTYLPRESDATQSGKPNEATDIWSLLAEKFPALASKSYHSLVSPPEPAQPVQQAQPANSLVRGSSSGINTMMNLLSARSKTAAAAAAAPAVPVKPELPVIGIQRLASQKSSNT